MFLVSDYAVTLLFIAVAACNVMLAPAHLVVSWVVVLLCFGRLVFRSPDSLVKPAERLDFVILATYAGSSILYALRHL